MCVSQRLFSMLSSFLMLFTTILCYFEEKNRLSLGNEIFLINIIESFSLDFLGLILAIIVSITNYNNQCQEYTEYLNGVTPVFYTECSSKLITEHFYTLNALSLLIHIYNIYKFRNEPSYYYRGLSYYFLFTNFVSFAFSICYSLTDDMLYLVFQGTFTSLLLYIPFIFFV